MRRPAGCMVRVACESRPPCYLGCGKPKVTGGRDLRLFQRYWDLSGLPAEDHHVDGLAQPPHRVANARGPGHDREPRAHASDVPPADPQPRVSRGEAASREGRLRGLSCMNGDIPVQFLVRQRQVRTGNRRKCLVSRGFPSIKSHGNGRERKCHNQLLMFGLRQRPRFRHGAVGLGEGVTATSPPYPTPRWETAPAYPTSRRGCNFRFPQKTGTFATPRSIL